MSKQILALGVSTFLAMAGVGQATRAATIDTYDFTQGGYIPIGASTSVLTGSFSGTVEAGGLIELADLSDLSFVFTVPSTDPQAPILQFSGHGLPSFFSFNTTGGSSSLDFTAIFDVQICVGAVTALVCGLDGFNGSVFDGLNLFRTEDLPVVTLVSSVTASIPESSTWALMLVGFAGLAFAGYRRTDGVAIA